MPKISVVIPALNEEGILPGTLSALSRADPEVEILVVDGGSTDQTEVVCRPFSIRFLKVSRGRGRQMNAGAAEARGDILWFLHADTRVTSRALRRLREAVADPRIVGGAFRFAVDSPRRRYRWLEKGVWLRSRLLCLPYGDQGVFARRDIFESLGGFPDWPLMEDIGFVKALRQAGRFVVLEEPIFTSARRWEERGFVATTARNLALLGLFALGKDPRSLSR